MKPGKMLRSLKFQLITLLLLTGMVFVTIYGYFSYNSALQAAEDSVCRELEQVTAFIKRYKPELPGRWEAKQLTRGSGRKSAGRRAWLPWRQAQHRRTAVPERQQSRRMPESGQADKVENPSSLEDI